VIAQGILESVKAVNGDVQDASKVMPPSRRVKVPNAPAGPVEPDETANAVHNISIKKVERLGGDLQNTAIYTYPHVPHFWKFNKEECL